MTTDTILEVEADLLDPNPWQPRRIHDEAAIRELADSIRDVGLLQRPMVRPKGDRYEIAFGHNRVEAIRLLAQAGQYSGPIPVEVRQLSDVEMVIVALTENRKRKDLTPLEEYRAWRKALDEIEALTVQELADKIGLDRSTVSNNLRLLQLPSVVLDKVDSGELSAHGAREFLCLMAAEDHAHLDVMEGVIKNIAGTSHGSAPDWRTGNIRRLIRDRVAGSTVQDWRRVGTITKNTDYGGSHRTDPAFDVEAFQKEMAQVCHTLPWDERTWASGGNRVAKEQTLVWTCDVKEWSRRQAAAQKAQEAAAPTGRKPKSDAEKEFEKVLQRDPVARAVTGKGVSVETAAREVAEALEPSFEEGEAGNKQAEQIQRLQAYVIKYMKDHPDPDDWEEMAPEQGGELELDELDFHEIENTVGGLIQQAQQQVKAKVESATPRRLSDNQKERMGTRAQVVPERSVKGFSRRLVKGQYQGVPEWFPDFKECLERCTVGATYVKSSFGGAELWCLNEEHFNEKLQEGLKAYRAKCEKQMGNINAEARGLVEELIAIQPPPVLSHIIARLILSSNNDFRPVDFGSDGTGRESGRGDSISYEPEGVGRIRDILSLQKPSNSWSSLSPREALGRLENKVSDEDILELAGHLLAETLRQNTKNGVQEARALLKSAVKGGGLAEGDEGAGPQDPDSEGAEGVPGQDSGATENRRVRRPRNTAGAGTH